jgi:hypothetical protein
MASSSSSSSSTSRRMLLAASSESGSTANATWNSCYKSANGVQGVGAARRRVYENYFQRQLHKESENTKPSRRSLASSGGSMCPNLETPNWGFCRDFVSLFLLSSFVQRPLFSLIFLSTYLFFVIPRHRIIKIWIRH